MINRNIVARKLESLRKCVARIEEKRPVDAEALTMDVDAQDIISINLERAIQVCVDMANHIVADQEGPPAETMGEAFDYLVKEGIIGDGIAARMRAAVGFRNLSVHAYDRIDWTRVYRIIADDIHDFRDFARSIAKFTGL